MQRNPGVRPVAVSATRFVRPSPRTRERRLGLHRPAPVPVPSAAMRSMGTQRHDLLVRLRAGTCGIRPSPRRPVAGGRFYSPFRVTWAPAVRAARWRA